MKAIVQTSYGSPDVLTLEEVDKPVVEEKDVLVRVHATSVNAGDIFSMRGSPWVARFAVASTTRPPATTPRSAVDTAIRPVYPRGEGVPDGTQQL
jgi:NADPH:quinone reductase-like Zn-dependent oxidoreductase